MGNAGKMPRIKIWKVDISAGDAQHTTDLVAEEKPLHVFLNNTHFVTILCSPSLLEELAVGHILSEGIIKKRNEIHNIRLEEDKHLCRIQFKPSINLKKKIELAKPFSRLITSSCGSSVYWPFPRLIDRLKLPRVGSCLTVDASLISDCVKNLNAVAETYRRTGGVHVAALYEDNGDLVALAEDVGRHNAVDKVIGMRASENADFGDLFLALSGRLTGDIVLKAARIGLPMIASHATAIKSGIEVAEHCKITLIGFVRGRRMNIYTCPERVTY
ncbi:MAG: formate dehydrogenase accessory sulfurtransferase FdhD [Candidatus Bathyarchaeota archaeon]|nr:MAG: formate dehydrogenase accessory sulfurtransferase FdhD [Candidatus Bathyarchaeota archaeon]